MGERERQRRSHQKGWGEARECWSQNPRDWQAPGREGGFWPALEREGRWGWWGLRREWTIGNWKSWCTLKTEILIELFLQWFREGLWGHEVQERDDQTEAWHFDCCPEWLGVREWRRARRVLHAGTEEQRAARLPRVRCLTDAMCAPQAPWPEPA